MPRPYPWKCRSCGEQSLSPKTVDYSTEMEHDGLSYSFVVQSLNLLECDSCHGRVLPDDAFVKVLDRLRFEADLLTPSQIKEKRKRISGLTQEMLAKHLRVAKETVSRWETGGQIQQRGHDTNLRLYFANPWVGEFLAKRAGVFVESQQQTAVSNQPLSMIESANGGQPTSRQTTTKVAVSPTAPQYAGE